MENLLCAKIYRACMTTVYKSFFLIHTNKPLFSHPAMSDSLRPHGLQHARPLCPSPSPKVCPSSCLLHQ